MCPIEDYIERCSIASMQSFSTSLLNMGSRKREPNMNVLKNRFISEDEDDIISLDPPPKIVLGHWDINIVQMFSKNKQALLSAKVLMDLVVSYKSSLRNKTLFYAYSERLSAYIINHVNYLHECFHDMEYYRINSSENANYFSLLEDVLAVYCSVELKTVSKIFYNPDPNNNREIGVVMTDEKMFEKRLSKVAQRMCFSLHNFLHRNENVLHVLMKMWYNKESPSCVLTVNYMYILLLHESPIVDKSDESFCRYVINYLLWATLQKEDCKDSMLGILYKKFGYDDGFPDSPFITKVLDISGEKMDVDKLIQVKNMTIERYFTEVKKIQQMQMFHDGGNDESRPYESFLFDVESAISLDEPDLESYDSDSSDDVVEIITLDSDDDDDIRYVPSNNSKASSSSTIAATSTDTTSIISTAPSREDVQIRPPPVPTLQLHTPLINSSMTTTSRCKVQRVPPQRRTPHLDNTTLSVLHTIAEAAKKAQSNANHSPNSVCNGGNSDSTKDSFSDISERFAAKRAHVRNRGRPSVDLNSISDMNVNPYMSPPSSSIGTPDNNYVEAVELAEVDSPKCNTASTGSSGVNGSTNTHHSANLLLYTPDSQDERADQSFELQPRTPTDSEERDVNSGLDEDHDTGQDQRKRKEIPHVDISPTSLSKRRKVNGAHTSTLLSTTSPVTKDHTDTTNTKDTTPAIIFTSSATKRRRFNSDNQNKLPWERDYVEQQKDDDLFSNMNDERFKDGRSSTNNPSQSVPEHRYAILSPPSRPIIAKELVLPICYKAPLLELEPPAYFTTETGVKGLLGSDVALLAQQAVEVDTFEVMKIATELTHTEYVRDKGFVQVVSQSLGSDEEIVNTMRAAARRRGQVVTEDGDGRRQNGTPNKDILKQACADLLLPDADQDETIGTTSSNHTSSTPQISIITNEEATTSVAAASSPASASSSYTLQLFDNFERQFQKSQSIGSSCSGSVHDDEPSALLNGLSQPRVSPVMNGDGDDRHSVHSFSPAYSSEELSERDSVPMSPNTTVKEKNKLIAGISAQVSSSSCDPSSNTEAAKNLHDENYTLKRYLFAYPSYLDLSRRKALAIKESRVPEIGRKRPVHLVDYDFPKTSPSTFLSQVFADDTKLCGTVGLDVKEISFSRPANLTKGNISYTPFSLEYSKNTQDSAIVEPLSILYDSNTAFNSDSIINSNVIDVSYTVTSNDSVCLNKTSPSLTIAVDVPKPEEIELEFSNSPTIFEETTKGLLEQMALQTDTDTTEDNVIIVADSSLFLANNTNYYLLTNSSTYCANDTPNACQNNVKSSIPDSAQASVRNTDHSINAITAASSTTSDELTPEEEEALNRLLQESMANFSSTENEGNGTETRLPFKKRRMSVGSKHVNVDPAYQQPKRKQRNSKQTKATSTCKEPERPMQSASTEISYPATKMISIAEVQEQNGRRSFKTAAERKEMPGNATNVAETETMPMTNSPVAFPPFYPCNGNRSGTSTVLNIPAPQSYDRSRFPSHAYQYSVPVLPPSLPSPLASIAPPPATLASAYYASLLTPHQFAPSMILARPAMSAVGTGATVGNNYACHHRLSGSVMAAATLAAATTTPQKYKPQQRRRSVVGAKKDIITTAARTRATSVQYK